MTKMTYQHLVPQERTHEIEVEWSDKKENRGRICKTCKKRVAMFDENEGPEGLKALLRF